jgi:hypothetical protein
MKLWRYQGRQGYMSDKPTSRPLTETATARRDPTRVESRRRVRNHRIVDPAGKNDTIVCPLWISNERRFRSRHYFTWDRACSVCGRKVVVSDAIKREIDADPATALVCEQCALTDAAMGPAEPALESGPQLNEECSTCVALNQQEEAAAREAWRLHNLRDEQANAARRKWAHLAEARVRHRRKAHGNEKRGKH